MMSIAIILVISFTCGYIAGLITASRIAKVASSVGESLTVDTPKKNTGVVKMGLNAPVQPQQSTSGVVRPKPPKQEDEDKQTALSSVRRRVGL